MQDDGSDFHRLFTGVLARVFLVGNQLARAAPERLPFTARPAFPVRLALPRPSRLYPPVSPFPGRLQDKVSFRAISRPNHSSPSSAARSPGRPASGRPASVS